MLDNGQTINMLDWLPDFLDGLFNMLADSNRDIRQAATSAIARFMDKIKQTAGVEYGSMVGILVGQCRSKERLNRLTAISWVQEFIKLGGTRLLLFYSELVGAIMHCISAEDLEIRAVADCTNVELLSLVRKTQESFELSPLLQVLILELTSYHIPTRMAALRWMNMLLEKASSEIVKYIDEFLPTLLCTLSDDADEVVITNLEVSGRKISESCVFSISLIFTGPFSSGFAERR